MTTATKIKIVVIVVLVSFSLAVIIQNTAPIKARILFLSISIPLTVLIGGSLIVGYLLGLLTPVLWRRRQERFPETPPAAETDGASESRGDDRRPDSLRNQNPASASVLQGPDANEMMWGTPDLTCDGQPLGSGILGGF